MPVMKNDRHAMENNTMARFTPVIRDGPVVGGSSSPCLPFSVTVDEAAVGGSSSPWPFPL